MVKSDPDLLGIRDHDGSEGRLLKACMVHNIETLAKAGFARSTRSSWRYIEWRPEIEASFSGLSSSFTANYGDEFKIHTDSIKTIARLQPGGAGRVKSGFSTVSLGLITS